VREAKLLVMSISIWLVAVISDRDLFIPKLFRIVNRVCEEISQLF